MERVKSFLEVVVEALWYFGIAREVLGPRNPGTGIAKDIFYTY